MDNPLAELEAWWVGRGQIEDEFGTDVLQPVETVCVGFATTRLELGLGQHEVAAAGHMAQTY